jgi:hypothetical protein
VRSTSRRLAVFAVAVATFSLTASPAGAVDRDGVYRGSTSQDRAMRFVVEGREISNVRLTVFHRPCDLIVITDSGDVTFRIADDNTFEMRFFASERRSELLVRGEFTSRLRARGRFRSVQDDRDCRDTVRGTWRLVRVDRA